MASSGGIKSYLYFNMLRTKKFVNRGLMITNILLGAATCPSQVSLKKESKTLQDVSLNEVIAMRQNRRFVKNCCTISFITVRSSRKR